MAVNKPPIRVVFVCMGNICRSPMAEAVFQYLVDEAGLTHYFHVTSSGLGTWHAGEHPHPGTLAVLKQHGIPFHPEKRAQVLSTPEMKQFHYILGLDGEIASTIQYKYGLHVKRLMEYAPEGSPLDVPDPYYTRKFAEVFALVEMGCAGLFSHIRQEEKT